MDKAAYKAQLIAEWAERARLKREESARKLVGVERLCVRCVHFEIERIGTGYDDDYTEADCFKACFQPTNIYDTDDLRGLIAQAAKCADYTEPTS